MTPCEELGYVAGDKFIMNATTDGFIKGQVIELYTDDGSACPLFIGDNTIHSLCNGRSGAHMSFHLLSKVWNGN
jgi:hypothetical protein